MTGKLLAQAYNGCRTSYETGISRTIDASSFSRCLIPHAQKHIELICNKLSTQVDSSYVMATFEAKRVLVFLQNGIGAATVLSDNPFPELDHTADVPSSDRSPIETITYQKQRRIGFATSPLTNGDSHTYLALGTWIRECSTTSFCSNVLSKQHQKNSMTIRLLLSSSIIKVRGHKVSGFQDNLLSLIRKKATPPPPRLWSSSLSFACWYQILDSIRYTRM